MISPIHWGLRASLKFVQTSQLANSMYIGLMVTFLIAKFNFTVELAGWW
jgi:hypothetical protein